MHVSLAIYDYQRNKVCDIYDSSSQADGQAYNIIYTEELSGWKEISFTLPFMANETRNFRWDYVKNEYQLRLKIDDKADWFVLQTPKKTRNGQSITDVVKCSHLSVLLKTKNLFLVLDDTNGIGTIDYLMDLVLTNTGWTLGECGTFYERDGETEKIRSLLSDGKRGAYQQISDICDLFNATPVFNGDDKTVDVYPINEKKPLVELTPDKNLKNISVELDTANIATRLYVEGEYGEFGYVGIDDVNPTGLSYLLNFDYYRSVGLFTATHEAALTTYLNQMPAKNQEIIAQMATVLASEDELNLLWGQIDYVIYVLDNGSVSRMIKGGNVLDGQEVIQPTDQITVLPYSGNYRVVTSANFTASDEYAVKFITLPSGGIGARQVAIESKEQMVTSLQADYAAATTDAKRTWIQGQITMYQTNINNIWNGTEDVTGLYEAMRVAIELAVEIDGEEAILRTLQGEQAAIESAFASVVGDMLKDGYWSNTNYAPGQEEWLYYDAIERMDEISKPVVKYSLGLSTLAREMGYTEGTPQQNAKVKILDEDMRVNDIAYVSKRTLYLDQYDKDTVEISNTGLRSAAVTFESVFGEVTRLTDLVNQRSVLYERAKAINANGTLPADKVIGDFNIDMNSIISPASSWSSDGRGGQVFESVLKDSAFKISGDGIMIASSQTSGEWDWKTIGNGTGMVADAISDGYLSVNRLEDYTVPVVKLVSDAGATLDISMNPTTQGIVAETGIENLPSGETLYSRITYEAGRITSEVERATAAENGKIAKTSAYQTADAIVTEAVRQSGVNASNSYIAKTVTYQTADAIVAGAESYVDGVLVDYSTTQQTATQISQYVANNAYGQVSGISITAAGIEITGSQYVKIGSRGKLIVTSGNFTIDASGNVALTGTVYANSGTIGGFTIAPGTIGTSTGSAYMAQNVVGQGDVLLSPGGLRVMDYYNSGSYVFKADTDGKVTVDGNLRAKKLWIYDTNTSSYRDVTSAVLGLL